MWQPLVRGCLWGLRPREQAGLTLQCGQGPWGHGGAIAGAGRAKEMGRLGVMLKRGFWDKLSLRLLWHMEMSSWV